MGYKKSDPCLTKAFSDELLFILMARDPSAPQVIMKWIEMNINTQPKEKLQEALATAIAMGKRQKEFRQRADEEKVAPTTINMEECDQCDGCGWHEGGAALRTTCVTCNGTGLVPKMKGFNSGSYQFENPAHKKVERDAGDDYPVVILEKPQEIKKSKGQDEENE